MVSNRKGIILFLALALPVLIFLFLKFFGRNQFDLPVFHTTSEEWPANCPPPAQFPFKVSMEALGLKDQPAILFLSEPEMEASKRIPVEIDTLQIQFQRLPDSTDPCAFGAPSGTSAVLIDSTGSIRGIFAALERDETDRLIMESKILLNDY